MLIIPKGVLGDNILEQNQNRIYLVKEESQNNLRSKAIEKLFKIKNKKQWKKLMEKILYEEIPELFVSLIYEKIDKNDFLNWYATRGEKGCFDLIKYHKLYI